MVKFDSRMIGREKSGKMNKRSEFELVALCVSKYDVRSVCSTCWSAIMYNLHWMASYVCDILAFGSSVV